MNTIYRIVWNVTLGKWVVASELAKGRKKKSSAKIAVLALALAGLGAPAAFAAETDSPEQTEKAVVAEESDFTITPFFAIGGGDDGGRTDTVAIGSGARALTMNSVALGSNALAGIGADGNAVGVNQVAIGTSANAQANIGIAIGQEAKALGKTGATAIGFRATAYASDDPLVAAWSATAMGTHAEANGDGAAALGDSAKAKGDRTAAFGRGASAEQNDATAFGAGTDINATGGTAIGSGAQVATGAIDGVAIGKDSVANRDNAVSVGSSATKRQIINVDVGTQDTDAVNLSQLKGTAQSVANALGGSASVNADGTVQAPSYTVADLANGGTKTVNDVGAALGQLNSNVTNLDGRVAATSRYFKANGKNDGTDDASVAGRSAIAIGSGAKALKTYSEGAVAIGNNALAESGTRSADWENSVAIGAESKSYNAGSVALGQNALAGVDPTDNKVANANYGVSIGTDSRSANGATAVGYMAKAYGDTSTALGIRATANASNSVALGKDSIADRANTVSVGAAKANGQRQIVNVAAGTMDTDVVNISQLKGALSTIGGGATVGSNGSIVPPSLTVGGNTYNNVAAALGDVDGRVTRTGDAITNIQADLADAVKYDSAAHDSVTLGGAGASTPVALRNIAEGALTATSTDAVNGSQLFATNERVTDTESNITNLDGRTTINEGDITDIRNQLGSGSIGLVQQDATSRDITVAAGTDGGRVDFTGTAGARRLAGVAEGELSATSKEAVNGSQLFATNERVTKNEGDITAIDGRVTQNEGDIITIGDRVTGAESNITNLDGRVTINEGDITDIRTQLGSGSIGLVQQDATSRDITVAAGTDGGRVDFTGTAGARRLAGVAEGELSATSNEAVNGSQLFATNERVTKTEGDIINLDGRVTKNEGDIINLGDRINSGSVGLVRQAGANAAVTVAAGTGGTVVDLTGTDGTRQIKGVSEGTDDTDAVNVGQLKKAGLVGGDGSTLDAVVYDAGSNRGSVTFGGLGGTKLTNVMAGIVSATSTDAVNGSQLWILQDQVGKLGDRVTNIEVNGAPVPGPAPEGRDPAFAANGDGGPATATGKDSVAAGTGAKASADNSVAIGAGSVADRADTVSVGSVGHERVVSNVAAGEQRTDAANWGQVQDALATANRYTDDRFDGVNRRIGEVQRQANRGIAASAALINVTPYMPGKTVLNAGVANYRGESALGVGVSRWNDTGRVNFNAGVSAAAGDSPIFRMGVGVVLGD